MIYLLRLIIWLVVIVFISWIVHRFVGEAISNKKVKPFIGIITFLVIVLTPMSIAKVAQVYYCWKYQPFYEIIEPLGDDFEGYYKEHNVNYAIFRELIKAYPNTIKTIDTKQRLNWYDTKEIVKDKSILKSNETGYVYLRYYLEDDKQSKHCVFPNSNYYKYIKRKLNEGKEVEKLEDIFSKDGKCIARKIISESEVSRYDIKSNTITDIYPFKIPGIVSVNYYKYAAFIDRETNKPYAWSAGVRAEWDLFGVLGKEGMKKSFSCWAGIDIRDKMIKQVGERNGN